MNPIADQQEIISNDGDLNENILEAAAKIGREPPAPEVTTGTMEISSWDESAEEAGRRRPEMPVENENSIAEQLVQAGNEQADHEQRAAAFVDERSNLNSAIDRTAAQTPDPTDGLLLIRFPTRKSVSEAAAALQAAVQANHFGVMQVHNLKETMAKKGVEFARECLIFEVCQPQQAKKVLDENMSVSTALPCRISIFQEDGKTTLATLKPTALLAMFETPQLASVAQEVEDTLVRIMKEAASTAD